jgi:hypothetical protein
MVPVNTTIKLRTANSTSDESTETEVYNIFLGKWGVGWVFAWPD